MPIQHGHAPRGALLALLLVIGTLTEATLAVASAAVVSAAVASAAVTSPASASPARAGSSTPTFRNLSLEGYQDQPAVRRQMRYFLGPGRRSIERALVRSAPYLSMIRRHLKREGLPEELAWLPLIESGFSSAAMSPAGAAGMWQFMPGTARGYGLRVDRYIDERRDAFRATRAAVHHLRVLTDRYGSPFLAAAAYNAGAAKVDRGLACSAISDARGQDFFRLSRSGLLSPETRDYVPKLIAAALIAEDPQRYGLQVDAPAEAPAGSRDEVTPAPFARHTRNRALAARSFPEVSPPTRTRATSMPPSDHPASAQRRRVVVRAGDTMASVAASYGVAVRDLCRANMLPAAQALRAGQILSLPAGRRNSLRP